MSDWNWVDRLLGWLNFCALTAVLGVSGWIGTTVIKHFCISLWRLVCG